MNQLISCIVIRDAIHNWYVFPIFFAVIGLLFGSRYRRFSTQWLDRRFLTQWLDGIRGRDWATVSAVIDVVCVSPQMERRDYGEYVVGYVATLTYFYRNPELQMGEYSRMFDEEVDAQAWAESYKGRTIMVNVDPRDPSKSVLLKEEL
jgi:hypothetical protein